MDCLDVLWMVVSPRSSHPFGLDVIGHNLVVIREGFVADCTFPVLLGYSGEGEHRFRREAERHSGAKVNSSRSEATLTR